MTENIKEKYENIQNKGEKLKENLNNLGNNPDLINKEEVEKLNREYLELIEEIDAFNKELEIFLEERNSKSYQESLDFESIENSIKKIKEFREYLVESKKKINFVLEELEKKEGK